VKSLKYKEYKEFYSEDIRGTIDLLDNHKSIKGNKYLTDRIMEAVLTPKEVTPRNNYYFQMKLASSFICTGIVSLVTNFIAIKNNIIITENIKNTIWSFNDFLSQVISKIQF
jgi:hypothetical protein